MTKKEILAKNPQGTMSMISASDDIVFSNGVVFKNKDWKTKEKLWRKLKKLGFKSGCSIPTDEEEAFKQCI